MRANEILKDLFFIERGYLNANHFVCRADAPVLIDTGYGSDFDNTQKLISDLGVSLSDVSLIVNTHTHCDHIGGNRRIQQQSGCDIALHHIGRHFIDTRDDWSTWWRYFGQGADFFEPTLSLQDGDVIAVGPYEFKIIYTPGHAADGIVLYNRRHKILISSDTLWERDMALMNPRVEGSTALFRMQASLAKIAALDVRSVYPGHGRPFTDLKKAIARSQKRIARFLNDRTQMGDDLLKKMVVYTLMMKKAVPAEGFYEDLMATHWFKETVDLYFHGRTRKKYEEIVTDFIGRGIITRRNGMLATTIKP